MSLLNLLVIALASSGGLQEPAKPQQPTAFLDVPIAVRFDRPPIPVKCEDGKWLLTYHALVMNWSKLDLTIKSVEIADSSGKVLQTYAGADLENMNRFYFALPYKRALRIKSRAELRTIPPGRTAALCAWIRIPTSQAMPTKLIHTFRFEHNPLIKILSEKPPGPTDDLVAKGLEQPVASDAPVVIGPPVRSGFWRWSQLDDLTGHQVYINNFNGQLWRPQKYSADISKVDEHGDILVSPFPDDINNERFFGYRSEILAVADGVVSFIRDGVPENKPLVSGATNAPVPLVRETHPGNQIAIDIGRGRYAVYAHLVPGSIPVKVGQRVKRGQVIALLGNSGNAAGPHLHFQVCDRPDVNASEGLPFVIDRFYVVWRLSKSKEKPANATPEHHVKELPLGGSILQFGSR
jgi:hypothetical protein